MISEEVSNYIIFLLKDYKESLSQEYNQNEDYWMGGHKYILNQMLRQLKLPVSHIFVSERALNLWNKITDDNILEKNYRDRVKCKSEENLPHYIGNRKTPELESLSIKVGSTFTYNDVFHDDHIIPLKVIIDKMINLENSILNRENINAIIEQIYICKMLKEEDRLITHKSKRADDLSQILDEDYNKIKVFNANELIKNGLEI